MQWSPRNRSGDDDDDKATSDDETQNNGEDDQEEGRLGKTLEDNSKAGDDEDVVVDTGELNCLLSLYVTFVLFVILVITSL